MGRVKDQLLGRMKKIEYFCATVDFFTPIVEVLGKLPSAKFKSILARVSIGYGNCRVTKS